MCTNSRLIYNRYVKKMIRCDCGKCVTCQQSKATARSNRIRYNVVEGEICLFVTLTYDNRFVPYIERSDLYRGINFPEIRRDYEVRRVRYGSGYFMHNKITKSDVVLDSELFISDDDYKNLDVSKLRGLSKLPSRIGVCYYKDVKDFFKRFRINYKRTYNESPEFTYYACSEYGGKSQRPHFHLLVFCKKEDEGRFRSQLVQAWPYADSHRTARFIEVARDAANYVASYVNCGNNFSPLLQKRFIKQKHSYSRSFGSRLDCFSLPSILSKIREGMLTFCSERIREKSGSLRVLPVPKYVIHRYFPQFKGFSRIPAFALYDFLLCPEKLYGFKNFIDGYAGFNYNLDLSNEDVRQICVMLKNAKQKYIDITGLTEIDFVLDYMAVWRCFSSTLLRLSYYDNGLPIVDYSDFYENLNEYFDGVVRAPTLKIEPKKAVVDPNKVFYRLRQDDINIPLYHRMSKQRLVTNEIMFNNLKLNV